MLKCRCTNCKQHFILPENYAETMIKCSECGAMNQPIPIQEKHQRFSFIHLPMDKLLGYLLCLVLGKRIWVIAAAILSVVAIVGVALALCGENSELVELRNLNRQASQMIYQNQPEEAIKVYDQILERIDKRSDKLAKEWTQRIRGAKTIAASKSEMNLLRKCQPFVAQADVLMKDGNISEAKKILKQVSDELENCPWKGKPTQALIARVRAMKNGR